MRSFIEDGWIVVSGIVAPDACAVLIAEVDRLVAEDPPPTGTVGPHFYWRLLGESPDFFEPLYRPDGVLAVAHELVGERGVEVAFDQAQIALNIPPYPHQPGLPHIDGYAPDQETPGSFTLLAALLLTDQTTENGGNLWVWPGTHLKNAAFFAAHGPSAFADSRGYPAVDLPEPTQIRGRLGDVLFAHYLLGHNIGGNYESDETRRAIYWRLRAPGHEERWEECLVDPWHEFDGVRRSLETG
jgi:hypothetical protein